MGLAWLGMNERNARNVVPFRLCISPFLAVCVRACIDWRCFQDEPKRKKKKTRIITGSSDLSNEVNHFYSWVLKQLLVFLFFLFRKWKKKPSTFAKAKCIHRIDQFCLFAWMNVSPFGSMPYTYIHIVNQKMKSRINSLFGFQNPSRFNEVSFHWLKRIFRRSKLKCGRCCAHSLVRSLFVRF